MNQDGGSRKSDATEQKKHERNPKREKRGRIAKVIQSQVPLHSNKRRRTSL